MYINVIVPCDTWTVLILHVVIRDRNMRLLPLALWSVNPRFELPTVFIFKYFINPSMEYLIPIWWPSVSKIVQKTWWNKVFTLTALTVRAWATLFVCPREQQLLRGAGLNDSSIGSIGCQDFTRALSQMTPLLGISSGWKLHWDVKMF